MGGPDQDGEEACGLGRLLLAEGDEVRLCQLDPLVVHTIAGRLSLTKPIPSNPAFVVSRSRLGGQWIAEGSALVAADSEGRESSFTPHRIPSRACSQWEAAFVEGEKTWSPGKKEGGPGGDRCPNGQDHSAIA